MRTAILIGMLGVSTACYSYNPLTTPSPEPGSYVAVKLTDAGSQELARYLGPTVFVVRGRYVGDTAAGIVGRTRRHDPGLHAERRRHAAGTWATPPQSTVTPA